MRASGDRGLFRTIVDNLCEGVLVVDRERKVLYWSPGAERITGYSSADVVGQRSCDGFLAHEDESGETLCTDRCPLARTLADGVPREANVFMHHKDGHRVPVCIRPVALKGKGGEISGALESFVETFTVPEAASPMPFGDQTGHVDSVTGLADRRATERRVGEAMSEMLRFGWPFGIVMLDVDNLEKVSGTYGRQAVDSVLRMVARTLASGSRPFDVVGRWAEHEFLIVIKNVDEPKLRRVVEKFRALVSSRALSIGQEQIHVTVSAGAAVAQPNDTPNSLAARAERLVRLGERRPAT
jgi:diguanylate cyclase (GGDEF)-like protein/PAS domain S-box-containing protein